METHGFSKMYVLPETILSRTNSNFFVNAYYIITAINCLWSPFVTSCEWTTLQTQFQEVCLIIESCNWTHFKPGTLITSTQTTSKLPGALKHLAKAGVNQQFNKPHSNFHGCIIFSVTMSTSPHPTMMTPNPNPPNLLNPRVQRRFKNCDDISLIH